METCDVQDESLHTASSLELKGEGAFPLFLSITREHGRGMRGLRPMRISTFKFRYEYLILFPNPNTHVKRFCRLTGDKTGQSPRELTSVSQKYDKKQRIRFQS